MSRAPLPTDVRLTREDALYAAQRLFARARHQSRKLANANGKTLHPELLKQMHQDIAECTRIALLLQGGSDV